VAERLSQAKRIQLRNLAEVEIRRYADDHAAWHKHIHNVELDSIQVLKCLEMDENPNTLDYSCRRTGKTAVKELYQLKHNACTPDQQEGVVAPRQAQSIVNINYHLDAIRRSEILSAFIDYKSGRRQIADTYYQFANRSRADAFGIMANVDGGDLTSASLEEVDDMPKDRLYSRFLLMLGSKRRLGAAKDSHNKPQIRITGVFKGNDTLTELIDSSVYKVLPIVNVYLGIEMGILHRSFMEEMRDQLAPDEYIRQLLCKNVTSRNLIWQIWVRRAMTFGLKAGIQLQEPMPGVEYRKRGLTSLGYDHTGHGENPHASRSSCVVLEQLGNFTCLIFARFWPPGTDEVEIKRELVEIWRYFRPDYGIGDAFGIGLITDVNDMLYQQGLITINRQTIGGGESVASTWKDWAFSPLRFEGMVKHAMAQAVRALFNKNPIRVAIPYFDDYDMKDPGTDDLRQVTRQLTNIVPEKSKAGYSLYKMVNPKIGDDGFDAFMAAVWALMTRGIGDIHTVVRMTSRSAAAGVEQALPPTGSY